MFTRMIDVMDNGTNCSIPCNKDFYDIVNKTEYSDIIWTVICIIIILDVIMN